MQSLDMKPNTEEKLERLRQDFDKPFSPPLEMRELLPRDHPSLDTGIDAHEWYDEGAAGAAEIILPARRSILKYHPPKILKSHGPQKIISVFTVSPLITHPYPSL